MLGLMIGAYIVLRCADLMGAAKLRYENPGVRGVMIFLAVVVALVSAFGMADMFLGGVSAGAQLHLNAIP
jgi:hypothetical protein